ncbi:hypothetical protein LTR47_006163 [Exophiala xenobiotica]|nr:hypothetical protein LTR47_006163 [Exophiala xenobiotica]KAK5316843.1 hypothetical protein LTR93_009155 [Exophiala xenobiotica]
MEITRYDSGTSWPAFFAKINATCRTEQSSLFPTPASALNDLDDLRSCKQQADLVAAGDLPPRAEFEHASSKFFSEINCVNYILSYEKYHAYTLNAFQPQARLSPSVFMLLCLILSLEEKHEQYLIKACEHFEHVLEEGSLASVEALMLMALCRLNKDQRNLAWIAVGCATRIAQTLGLHLKESHWDEKSQLVIENRRRLWWSLYDMEVCLAFRLGRCVAIDLASCSVGMPSETVFNYVPNCPPNYHTAVSELTKINGLIVQDLYGSRSASICLDDRADELIADLERFWNTLPYHLRPDAPTAPSHSRAVLYLGLRYHYTMLIATRPSIVSCWREPNASSPGLTRRVDMFESANKGSLSLLKRMAQADVLSGKSHLDASYILGGVMIFLLRIVKDPSQQLLDEAVEYRSILELAQHLDVGRAGMRTFDTTIAEVKSTLDIQGQVQDVEYTSIDDFLQRFVDVDECIWPALPGDGFFSNICESTTAGKHSLAGFGLQL